MTSPFGNAPAIRRSHGGAAGRAASGDERREILTIVGPTAVGKTAVAIEVARRLRGEIVSADSRQIYRGMDIGTAKPTAAERARVRHHLIDIVEPAEPYDAARYAEDAERVIARLLAVGTEPIVAGGTGLYLASLFEGLFDGAGRDDEVRDELRSRLAREGAAALHRELARVDPESAARVHPNDAARIVRALEVSLSTGRPLSVWQEGRTRAPAYRARTVALTMDRESLYVRIERRVDAMIEAGLLDEVRGLVASGRLREGTQAASAVGYRELIPLVGGPTGEDPAGLAEAVEQIKTNSRRYAKRQVTWFSRIAGVTWIDVGDLDAEEAAAAVLQRGRGAG
jgi:tRNA dimethylallyltransferase